MAKKHITKKSKVRKFTDNHLFYGGGNIQGFNVQNFQGLGFPQQQQSMPNVNMNFMNASQLQPLNTTGSGGFSGKAGLAQAGQVATDIGVEVIGRPFGKYQRGLYDAADPLYHLAGDNKSVVGEAVSDVGVGVFKASAKSGNLLGMAAGGVLKGLGSGINALFGTSVDQEKLNRANAGTDALNSFSSNATSFDDVNGPEAQLAVENAYSGGAFRKRWARRRNNRLRQLRNDATSQADRSVENNVNNIADNQIGTGLSSYYAFGGPLHTYGTDWSNGITLVGNGGTHEENPFEGVPVGVAPDGKLNLVEEGEVIFNDYVFSNRIKVPRAVREKYKLRGTKDMTFADAAKKAQKESEERPNDPISKRGLEDIMGKLTMEQEILKNKKSTRAKSSNGHKYAEGDYLYNWGTEEKTPHEEMQETPAPWLTEPVVSPPSEVIVPYKAPETSKTSATEPKQSSTSTDVEVNPRWGGLRYAPAIGSGLAVLTDTLGLTNKADYSNADALIAAGNNIKASQVDWNPIGNYLTYRPFDRLFYANQLGAQAAATRRAITNNSGGNRAAAIANLLAADYNAQTQLGNLYRQAEEYNLEQRAKVEDFNRGTNMANSEGMLKAAMANQDANLKASGYNLEALMKASQMREAARMYADKNRSENLSNFIESLGNIGRENEALNARDFFLLSGGAGPVQPGYEKLLTGNNGLLSKLRTKKSKKKNKKG
mgnify:CR=1 FL=1